MDNEKLYEDMKPKEKFEVLWAESGLADRPGAENLWQQMVDLGFFEKPASIKHHSNHPGGLCEHSVCVAEAAMELCRTGMVRCLSTALPFRAHLMMPLNLYETAPWWPLPRLRVL